ncbi:MAG: hypothetical protein R3E13_04240 [Alphaproteobacteria bacterium]
MSLVATENLIKKFQKLTIYNPQQDFYKQEIPTIFKLLEEEPNLSVLSATKEHERLRGLSDYKGRYEHDAAHFILGLIYNRCQKASILEEKDYIDFQTGSHSEVLIMDIETKISPKGVLNNYHASNPNALKIKPDDFSIIESVESEENYYRTLGWIIGGEIGQRIANIRYISGDNDEEQGLRGKSELENIMTELGYKTAFHKEADFQKITWSVKTPEGKKYYWNSSEDYALPEGHNGTEIFQTFTFHNKEMLSTIYKLVNPLIDLVRVRAQEKSMDVALNNLTVREVINETDNHIAKLEIA